MKLYSFSIIFAGMFFCLLPASATLSEDSSFSTPPKPPPPVAGSQYSNLKFGIEIESPDSWTGLAPATLTIAFTLPDASISADEAADITAHTSIEGPNGASFPWLADGGQWLANRDPNVTIGDRYYACSRIEVPKDAAPGEYRVKVYDLVANFKIVRQEIHVEPHELSFNMNNSADTVFEGHSILLTSDYGIHCVTTINFAESPDNPLTFYDCLNSVPYASLPFSSFTWEDAAYPFKITMAGRIERPRFRNTFISEGIGYLRPVVVPDNSVRIKFSTLRVQFTGEQTQETYTLHGILKAGDATTPFTMSIYKKIVPLTASVDNPTPFPGQQCIITASGGAGGPYNFMFIENGAFGSLFAPEVSDGTQRAYKAGATGGTRSVVEVGDAAGHKTLVEINVAVPIPGSQYSDLGFGHATSRKDSWTGLAPNRLGIEMTGPTASLTDDEKNQLTSNTRIEGPDGSTYPWLERDIVGSWQANRDMLYPTEYRYKVSGSIALPSDAPPGDYTLKIYGLVARFTILKQDLAVEPSEIIFNLERGDIWSDGFTLMSNYFINPDISIEFAESPEKKWAFSAHKFGLGGYPKSSSLMVWPSFNPAPDAANPFWMDIFFTTVRLDPSTPTSIVPTEEPKSVIQIILDKLKLQKPPDPDQISLVRINLQMVMNGFNGTQTRDTYTFHGTVRAGSASAPFNFSVYRRAIRAWTDTPNLYPEQQCIINAERRSRGTTSSTFTLVENNSGATLYALEPPAVPDPYGHDHYGYKAGTTGGGRDVIEVTDGMGNKSLVEMKVGVPPIIAPLNPSVDRNGTIQFTFSGSMFAPDAPGRQNWLILENNSGGRMDVYTGLYTAGPNSGSDVIGLQEINGFMMKATVTVNE